MKSITSAGWPMLFRQPSRRQFGAGLVTAAALLVLSDQAEAQAPRAPKGPIEITVGTSPGGTPDVIMRRAAKVLAETKLIEQPIVVQNRTGGSWTTAANWVLNKKGDENTVLAIAGPIFTTPITQGQPTIYDRVAPISLFVQGELVVAVPPNSPSKTLKDLVEQARQRERGVKVAGSQVGATDHLVAGLLEKAGNVKFNYIPFDGGGAAQAAFMGGNSDFIVLSLSEAVPLMQSGKARAVAILSESRRTDPEFKDVPTAKEQGLDVVHFQTWGLAGPPDLDPAIVKWWDEKLAKMVQTDAWKAMLKESFFRSDYVDSSRARQHSKEMHDEFLTILRQIGLAKI